MTDCLEYTSRYRYTSIGFPVLGSESVGYPPDDVVGWIVEALAEFRQSGKETTIKNVFIVVDPAHHLAVKHVSNTK